MLSNSTTQIPDSCLGNVVKVSFYLPSLSGGGTERCILALAGDFVRRGYSVDLVLDKEIGAYLDQVPNGVKLVVLEQATKPWSRLQVLRAFPGDFARILLPVLLARKPVKNMRYVSSLAEYLKRERPDGVIAALYHTNLVAIWARKLAKIPTRLLVSEQNNLSQSIADDSKIPGKVWRAKYIANIINRCYPHADSIVSVSDGVSDDLAKTCNLDRKYIHTVYSPVIADQLFEQANQPLSHPWFAPGEDPVILAIGRLETQKDHKTLLDAFALVLKERNAKLLILGEGKLRESLQDQARALGISAHFDIPGWYKNPYQYMRNAALFVCSSLWEGLPTVIIEAMACGCPIVSTDCPNGPNEILQGGQLGRLVPPADPAALAAGIIASLAAPRDTETAAKRAKEFSVEACASQYEKHLFPNEWERAAHSRTSDIRNQ